jgi:hypothetical protein
LHPPVTKLPIAPAPLTRPRITPSLANLPSRAVHGASFGRPDATSSRVGNSPGLILQIEHAATLSNQAKLVKLADKICNVAAIQDTQ